VGARHTSAGGRRGDYRWEYGAVEAKIPGKKMEVSADSGFDWKVDAPKIDPRKGGSTKEQIDAWKLLAVLMHHGDNKAANQRLFCAKGKLAEDGTCTEAHAMIQDIGASFGSAAFIGLGYKKAELGPWEDQPIWKNLRSCQGNLTSQHQLEHPVVSDAGRAFLAKLLDKNVLTDEKVKTIFAVSRIAERGQKIGDRLVTVDDWVNVFNAKRAEIARNCGQ
jgi:hypothetical protein